MAVWAKLVIGGSLLAGLAAGVIVVPDALGGDGNTSPPPVEKVPLTLSVNTAALRLSLPGTPTGTCDASDAGTKCTSVVSATKGGEGPIQVQPLDPLPAGVDIVYWGCREGPQALSCTVKAEAESTICITTTDPRDAAARQECGALADTGETASPSAAPPPWALLANVWNRADGATFSFDGADARWGPPNPNDFTVCRYAVPDLYSSTNITMNCSDLDRKWTAEVNLSASGDIAASDRILTISGDPLLSGTYRNQIDLGGGSQLPAHPG
jgi:hypothetical protein